MKSSEAKPLSAEELLTLKQLFQRWLLVSYPYDGGSSEQSDAYVTYWDIDRDAQRGHVDCRIPEEIKERIAKYGESKA